MSSYFCFQCSRELELSQLFLCECSEALFCSEACSALQVCGQHFDAPKRTPEESDATDSNPKRTRGDPELRAAEREAKGRLRLLTASDLWKKNTASADRFRLILADAGLPASELIKLLKRLRPPEYYPYALHNQAIVTQPPLNLDLVSSNDPTVVAVLSSAQRVVADTWGPWSLVKGGEAKWETGVGKTPLLHAIARNYRHSEALQPNLLGNEPGEPKEIYEGCTVLVVTQPHLRDDIMKGLWAQNNRDPNFITAQIRSAGLPARAEPTPFSAANVITGRMLTNAMEGVGPLGRALWSGLPIGADKQVRLL